MSRLIGFDRPLYPDASFVYGLGDVYKKLADPATATYLQTTDGTLTGLSSTVASWDTSSIGDNDLFVIALSIEVNPDTVPGKINDIRVTDRCIRRSI